MLLIAGLGKEQSLEPGSEDDRNDQRNHASTRSQDEDHLHHRPRLGVPRNAGTDDPGGDGRGEA